MPESHKPSWTDIAAANKADANAMIPSEWLIPVEFLPPPSKTKVDDLSLVSDYSRRRNRNHGIKCNHYHGKNCPWQLDPEEAIKAICCSFTSAGMFSW